MPYTADDVPRPSSEELRARIPGWGADLDPRDRPAVPREVFDPAATGAHWTFPERQENQRPREKSIEHLQLPPVYGTSVPLRGLSGAVRRLAYARFSEARAAHWVMLLGADRIEAYGSQLRSLASRRPDNPLGTGLRSELTHGGLASRRGRRVDTNHMWLDPLVVGAPWVGATLAVVAVRRRLRGGGQR